MKMFPLHSDMFLNRSFRTRRWLMNFSSPVRKIFSRLGQQQSELLSLAFGENSKLGNMRVAPLVAPLVAPFAAR